MRWDVSIRRTSVTDRETAPQPDRIDVATYRTRMPQNTLWQLMTGKHNTH